MNKPSENKPRIHFSKTHSFIYTKAKPDRSYSYQSPMETKYGGDDPQNRKTMRAMVAVDESDWSFYALSWALGRLFINAPSTVEAGERQEGDLWKVTVVHVTEPFHHFLYPAGTSGGAYYATTSVVESVKKAQEETAATILSRALQICTDKMVKAETLIMTGDPKDMICQATEQMHVDLLVVGSRGLGKVKRAFLGSVSDYCAHHAASPVVIVKPPRGSAPTK